MFAASVAVAVFSLIAWVFWSDFNAWKKGGTGGTPPTLKGYIKIRRWGLYMFFHPHSPVDISTLPDTGPAYLSTRAIPPRTGPKPKFTRWALPQRQHPTPITPEARTTLLSIPHYFATTRPYSHYLSTAPSKTEGGKGPGIYVNPDIPTINPRAKNIFYEVAHVHPQDNSLHVYVSPRDARLVIERGWGVRFSVGWIAPETWIMVFAPRDEEEVEVVRAIVRAACCFAVGKEVGSDEVKRV